MSVSTTANMHQALINKSTIDGALAQNFTPPKPTASYLFSLFLVSFLVVLLPLIYIGITAVVAYGVVYYAVNYVSVVTGSANIVLGIALYTIPVLAGSLFFLFMLRPFVPRGGRYKSVDLRITEKTDPTFVHFVHGICDKVGARRPKEIRFSMEANASAAFISFFSLFSNNLVLTIGFPLISCMSTKAVAGILAHEFGHFSQRISMRSYYLTNRINRWFYYCVYGGDGWNDWVNELNEKANNGLVGWAILIAQGGIYVTNKLLALLAHLSQTLTFSLSRKMEFDADKYEILLCGSEQFEASTRALHRTAAATQMAFNKLNNNEDNKYVDNIPALISLYYTSMPDKIDQHIDEQLRAIHSSKWDTHPPDRERIDQALTLDAKAIFELDEPAIKLFDDYEEKSKTATMQFYQAIGLNTASIELKSVESTLKSAEKSLQYNDTLQKLCNQWFSYSFVWGIPKVDKYIKQSDEQLVSLANQCIAKLRASIPENDASLSNHEKAYNDMMDCQFQYYCRMAGYQARIPHAYDHFDTWKKSVVAQYQDAEKTIKTYNAYFGHRVLAASMLLKEPKRKKQALILIKLLQYLKNIEKDVLKAEEYSSMLKAISTEFYSNDDHSFAEPLRILTQDLEDRISRITKVIASMPAKVASERNGKDMLEARKDKHDTHAHYPAHKAIAHAGEVLACFYDFNQAISGHLAKIVLTVEKVHKVQPIKILLR